MQGLNALHFASSAGNTESIRLLLEAGADVAADDNMVRVNSTSTPHHMPPLPLFSVHCQQPKLVPAGVHRVPLPLCTHVRGVELKQ